MNCFYSRSLRKNLQDSVRFLENILDTLDYSMQNNYRIKISFEVIQMNARPKKDETQIQDKQVGFWVTPEEKEEIKRLAEAYGYKKTSDFMRRACLGFQEVDRSKLE